jgi:hypothetical protein
VVGYLDVLLKSFQQQVNFQLGKDGRVQEYEMEAIWKVFVCILHSLRGGEASFVFLWPDVYLARAVPLRHWGGVVFP